MTGTLMVSSLSAGEGEKLVENAVSGSRAVIQGISALWLIRTSLRSVIVLGMVLLLGWG